jgi:hypothetical protein
LIRLWECALAAAFTPKIPSSKRVVALNLVLLVMERDDFTLKGDVCGLDIRRKYNKLLVST